MIEMIVAADLNNGIGRDNKLLANIKDDLLFFKSLTMNKKIIMGRKTIESLPFKLPGRKHIVITRDKNYVPPFDDVAIYTSIDDAVLENSDAVIIGGGEIYTLALDKGLVDKIYLTLLMGRYKADTFIPDIPESFSLIESHAYEKNDRNECNFSINTFLKQKPACNL